MDEKPVCLCFLLFLLLSATWLTGSSIETTTSGIVVEDAREIWSSSLENSIKLSNAAENVAPRIVADQADTILALDLNKSNTLNQPADLVKPRIIIEYADSLLHFNLTPPYPILPIPQEQPIPQPENQTEVDNLPFRNPYVEEQPISQLFSSQYTAQLPDGNTLTINSSTTSEIVKDITLDLHNNRLCLQVNEHNEFASYYEMGFLAISIPKEFFEAYNFSIDKLAVIVDGKEVAPTYVKEEEGYLIRLEYGYGRHIINIYYLTFTLRVHVRSIFGLPVSKVTVVLEWPDGAEFKTSRTSSSGIALFKKVPSLNSLYTLYVKYSILSFQNVPKEILINQDTETSFTAYLYFDTFVVLLLSLIMSIVAWRIQKRRKKTAQSEGSKS